MQIIELTETQFKNYAKIHSSRHIYQTIEYANLMQTNGYDKLYLGFSDDNNNVMAATLILTYEQNKKKIGYAPGGFLIDFKNLELLKSFTSYLKKYLEQKKYVYLRLNPSCIYKIYNKKDKQIYFNDKLIETMKALGYNHLGFINSKQRFQAILRVNSNPSNIYRNFNYNIRNNITKSLLRAITIHKGDIQNIELFYNFMKQKSNDSLTYYQNYLKNFNSDDNKFEFYFAKIDPKIYINNYRYLLKKEQERNIHLNSLLQDSKRKTTASLINKKMTSDKKITSYNNEIVKATNLYKDYPDGLVLGTVGILRNNREVYFLFEASNLNFKRIYSSYLMKWEIMKKYMKEGFTIFNFGDVFPNRSKTNNPNYGLYLSKIAFNANIYEFPGEFDLVINKMLYKMFITFNVKKNKS